MELRKAIALMLTFVMVFAFVPGYGTNAIAATTNASVSMSELANVAPGDTVTMTASIKDNPGLLGAIVKLQYASDLTLISAKNGTAFSALTLTKPGKFESGCKFVWDGQELETEDIQDGEILTLTFEVSGNAKYGSELPVNISVEDATDTDLNSTSVTSVNGKICIQASKQGSATLEKIVASGEQLEYAVGDKIDVSGDIYAVYSDGSTCAVTEYTTNIADIDMSTVGTKEVKIDYTEGVTTVSTSFEILVKDKNRISYISASKKVTTYYVGDTINVDDITVEATYADGTVKNILDYKTNASGLDITTTGEKQLEVSCEDGDIVVTSIITLNVLSADQKPSGDASSDASSIANASFAYQNRYTCTGKALQPAVKVTLGGKVLVKGTDYTVAYSNNTNYGYGTITITGINNYTGSKLLPFAIVPGKVTGLKATKNAKGVKLSWISHNLGHGTVFYAIYRNGKLCDLVLGCKFLDEDAIEGKTSKYTIKAATFTQAKEYMMSDISSSVSMDFVCAPSMDRLLSAENSICVRYTNMSKLSGAKLVIYRSVNGGAYSKFKTVSASKDYCFDKTVKQGKVYRYKAYAYAKVSGKTYKSAFSNEKMYLFQKALSFGTVKAISGGKINITWKKAKGVSGYEVKYSAKASLSSAKIVKVKKNNVTLKGLKKNTKYYIVMRSYKVYKGKKYYSCWNTVNLKQVTTLSK